MINYIYKHYLVQPYSSNFKIRNNYGHQRTKTAVTCLQFLTFKCVSSDSVLHASPRWTSSLACSLSISDFWFATNFWSLLRKFVCLSNSRLRESNDFCSSDTSDFHLSQWQQCTEIRAVLNMALTVFGRIWIVPQINTCIVFAYFDKYYVLPTLKLIVLCTQLIKGYLVNSIRIQC